MSPLVAGRNAREISANMPRNGRTRNSGNAEADECDAQILRKSLHLVAAARPR